MLLIYKNMSEINTNNSQYWELLLQMEWLWNLDTLEWFWEVQIQTKIKTLTLLDISKIEDEYKVKFKIESENQSIELYTIDWKLIWYIKPGFYTYGNVSKEAHLERKIFDDFIWKWYGQLLYDVYRWLHFPIPKEEYTHKASVILFLQKNGYTLVSKFDENGDEGELDYIELAQLDIDLEDKKNTGDEDLDYTYKLVL